MPQKTIQDLDAYIKATAVVYDHSNTKLVSRKTKVSRRRKEAFLSVLPYRKPSSHYHPHERKKSSSITRKPRSKPATESVISNPKQKLNISVQTSENANDNHDAPQTLSFQLDLGTSVQSLKELIEKQIGVEARYQCLYNRQNFQLCDLLTLEENGVDKNEIISLRLSKDDRNCNDVPQDKTAIDHEYLKDLSSKLESSRKELAKHLGYEEAEIADIQTTNEGSTEESRHMLLTWWEKTTDRDEAAQKLRRALEAIGLTDLAQNVPVTSESRDETAGAEPERRQDAGVDEESKQNGAVSTEDEKLKNDELPKDKAAIDYEYLKGLSPKIESSWKELAKHLGYEEAEIADIQTTNEGSNKEIRHMLLTWWEKMTDRDEAAQKLRRALEAIGLSDLAQNVPVMSKSRDEAAGPEPERRKGAGVDKESKQKGAASTEEEKLEKEQVFDQDKPQLISRRYLQVFIRGHCLQKPKIICLRLDPETSVLILKVIINEKIGVHPQQQRLFIRRNFRNFELNNLLTLHDCGIDQDENISLRLCTDGLLGGGPKDTRPDDKSIWNDSKNIGTRWEELALNLNSSKEEVEIIKANHSNDVVRQCFEMLSTWWRKQDNYPEAWRTLEKALVDSGRNDLVQGTSVEMRQSRVEPGRSPTASHETPCGVPAQLAADKCEKKLKDIYTSTGSYVQMLPWVDDDQRHIMDIYTKLQLQKDDDYDDLKGEVKSYSDIFKLQTREGHPIIRAILRGLPGLGKTTLFDKIAYDWARGDVSVLNKYKLVFVLKMHSLKQESDVIDALFDQLLDEHNVNRDDLKPFIKAQSNKVLFLLDGFDEFMTTELDEKKFGSLLKMLNRKGEYGDCSVLVTTRPSHYHRLAKHTLIQRPFGLVDVLGFSEDDIQEYTNKFYSEEPSKANGLLNRITSSEVLSDLAKSPMLLLLMCLLWRESSTLPNTLSRLFNEALKYIFRRKTKMSEEKITRLVIAIGKVALNGLLSFNPKLSFQEKDFEPDVLAEAIRAGILTSQRVLKGMDTYKSVYFIHKTFQEFCAAMYYRSLDEHGIQQFATFFKHTTSGFEYLLRFCCADNDGPRTESILDILLDKEKTKGILGSDGNENSDGYSLELALNCYFESQCQTLPPEHLIDSILSDTLTINTLSSDTLTSLMYFLDHITKDREDAHLKKVHVLQLNVDLKRFGEEFANCASRMTNVSKFKVYWRCSLTEKNIATSVRNKTHLTELNIQYIDLGRCTGLSSSMKGLTQLTKVKLHSCNLTMEGLKNIAASVSNLPNLVELDLSSNKGLAGSGHSWSHLAGIQTIRTLSLKDCNLEGSDIRHIAEELSNMPNLVVLDLSVTSIFGSVCHNLERLQNLKRLHLSRFISKEGNMEDIAEALSNMPNLVELDLSGNNSIARKPTFHHLSKIKSLKRLDLSVCNLDGDDMDHIIVVVGSMTNLTELDLSHNQYLIRSGDWSRVTRFKQIQKLHLRYSLWISYDFESIVLALSNTHNIVELDLTDNQYIGCDRTSEWWRRLITKLQHMRKLSLHNCGLTSDHKSHIREALAQMKTNFEVEY